MRAFCTTHYGKAISRIVLTAFHMMQFGNMSERCIKTLESGQISANPFEIKALGKDEIEKNWHSIWKATESIINHLKGSPIFYPGSEFTESVYRDYFMSDSLGNDELSVNVGEAFVYPQYRKTGLARQLLCFAQTRAMASGYKYMWVEHGTANPNARGFWNKYFETYQYELVRRIG